MIIFKGYSNAKCPISQFVVVHESIIIISVVATQIKSMLNTIEKYSALNTVKLEGFDPLVTKYKVIVTTMQKKGYDFLDQRKATFDDDFDYFNNQIAQLANSVMVFSETAINKRPSVTRCLEVLNRYPFLNQCCNKKVK